MYNDDLIVWLEEEGYKNLRELPDGTIAGTIDLMYTRALFLDLTFHGWETRYCFKDRIRAEVELNRLKSCNDEPTGYTAKRTS
jgi:hypothetical protein